MPGTTREDAAWWDSLYAGAGAAVANRWPLRVALPSGASLQGECVLYVDGGYTTVDMALAPPLRYASDSPGGVSPGGDSVYDDDGERGSIVTASPAEQHERCVVCVRMRPRLLADGVMELHVLHMWRDRGATPSGAGSATFREVLASLLRRGVSAATPLGLAAMSDEPHKLAALYATWGFTVLVPQPPSAGPNLVGMVATVGRVLGALPGPAPASSDKAAPSPIESPAEPVAPAGAGPPPMGRSGSSDGPLVVPLLPEADD
jgi:hypothetical protein